MKNRNEEMVDTISALEKQIGLLLGRMDQLQQENKELRERLNKSPRNSSKPSSGDGVYRK